QKIAQLAKSRHLHVAIYGNEVTEHSHQNPQKIDMVSATTMILSGRKSPPFLPTRFRTRVGPAQGSGLGPNGAKFKFRDGITMRVMGKLICLPHPQTDN
ncbi:hypothetical protein PpBr36_04397, partial [Pyricularia pennisetigena]|uniref:hypothetical protein n=1 Tax=Pyricularia pennisetigena TaxID=1578925 RepID=UPI0011543C19